MTVPHRFATALTVAVGLLFGADVASAHDPIILNDAQTTPDSGPFLPDGTISFALYGSFGAAGETRGLRAQFNDGERLHVSLLIPNLEPENVLNDDELPVLDIVDPRGESLRFEPATRTVFDEPFTGTSYVELVDHVDTAMTGVYAIMVTGRAPSRFTVSVGDKETFGTPVEGVVDRSAGVEGVMEWYAVSPASVSTTTVLTESSVEESPIGSVAGTSGEKDGNDETRTIALVLVVLVILAVVRISRRSRRQSRRSSQR